MDGRERLTRIYRGEVADRVPWAPLIFEDTLSLYPPEIRELGPRRFTKIIGGDVLWRMSACKIENDALKVIERKDETHVYKEYRTRIGSLYEIFQKSKFGVQYRAVKRLIENLRDFKVIEYVLEHQVAKPNYESLLKVDKEVGDSGIIMVFQTTSPVQSLIQEWMGLTRFYSFLLRHAVELENLMALMHEKNKEVYEIMAESPVEVQCIVENTDSRLVSPKIYEKYTLKHVKDFVDTMHAQGKIAIVHMCGKINELLPLVKQTGLDGIDCLTPRPTGNVNFRNVYQIFGNKFVIHGVLDPTKWLPDYHTADDIERSVDELIKETLNKPFILCTAADGIPGIPIEKFKAIGHIMQKYIFQPKS